MDDTTLIYCAAGNKRYASIAIQHGFKYGAQLPNTVYNSVFFADQDWKCPNFQGYIAALEKENPKVATVIDYDQSTTFKEVIRWSEAASKFVQDYIIIIPKICGTIEKIPHTINGKRVVLGYSVPTTHGGTEVPIWEFYGREVHLLGGSPQKQMELMRYLNVVSADGNYISKMANKYNQFFVNGTARFAKNRFWPQLRETKLGYIDIDAPYLAFELSCINFKAAMIGNTSTIRFAVEEDIPAIKKIANQFKSELGYVMYPSLRRAIVKKELYIAEYGQRVVGFVNWHKRRDGWHTIYEIAVDKQRHREKIGSALLNAVPNPKQLKCTIDNDNANLFYEQKLLFGGVENGRKRRLNIWKSQA